MQVHWPTLCSKLLIWLCAEVALTCLGVDDLADYGEFVFQARGELSAPAALISLAIPA